MLMKCIISSYLHVLLDFILCHMRHRCIRDNAAIYYQPVPKTTPALPEPKRAVEVLPMVLPNPSAKLPQAAAAELVASVSGGSKLLQPPKGTPTAPVAAVAVAGNGHADSAQRQSTPHAVDTATANDIHAAQSSKGTTAATIQPAASTGTAAASTSAPAAVVASAGDHDAPPHHAEPAQCSPLRCLVYILVCPLLVLISLVGAVVWVLLLPFKLCCCCLPCACAVQLAWDVFAWMIRAPLNGLLWAAGKDWHPQQQQHSTSTTTTKVNSSSSKSTPPDIEAPAASRK